jgi:hypothetical protein
MSKSSLADRIVIPAAEEINIGLSPADEYTMLGKFGIPGRLTGKCGRPVGELSSRIIGLNTGPFRIFGLDYAVLSLKNIFYEVGKDMPHVYSEVKNAGMICVRGKRKNPDSFSNHSWGTAIDLYFGDMTVPQGVPLSHRGILLLLPYFNKHGWYWGAGFPGNNVDSMHFELAEETILNLPDLPPALDYTTIDMFANAAIRFRALFHHD